MVVYGPQVSDKHNQSQQHSADGRVTHARRTGGSVVKSGSVHAVCLVDVWAVRSAEGKTQDNILPKRTNKRRPLVLKPG